MRTWKKLSVWYREIKWKPCQSCAFRPTLTKAISYNPRRKRPFCCIRWEPSGGWYAKRTISHLGIQQWFTTAKDPNPAWCFLYIRYGIPIPPNYANSDIHCDPKAFGGFHAEKPMNHPFASFNFPCLHTTCARCAKSKTTDATAHGILWEALHPAMNHFLKWKSLSLSLASKEASHLVWRKFGIERRERGTHENRTPETIACNWNYICMWICY